MFRILLAIVAAILAVPAAHALSSEQWRADIHWLVELIESEHPDPFTRVSREEFHSQTDHLLARVDALTDAETAVGMMALVASIRDGHTTLHPKGAAGFTHWLPLSFYWFADGIFVVAAQEDYEELIGRRVLAIGEHPIEDVMPAVTRLMGSDNEFGNRQNVFYLGSGEALQALGFIDRVDEVRLSIEDETGLSDTVSVPTLEVDFVLDETRFWGEMFAPVPWEMRDQFVMPLDDWRIDEYIDASLEDKAALPLHLRNRGAYWSIYLPEEATYYLQFNFVTSAGRGDYDSFAAFYDEVFDWLAENPVDKFVLDIRYNFGGDGSILIPFVHKFVRDDNVNRDGHLFTIIGRKSYSAATMLIDLMLKHTNTVLVGEPAGSALNSYGDPRYYELPNSGMSLDLSSEYWKLVHTAESPPLTPVDIPAVFTSSDYFGRRDPAMERILAIEAPYRTLDQVLATDGREAATRRYLEEQEQFAEYRWWRPFDESDFRKIARAYTDEGDYDNGIAGFEILVDAYPDSWRAWRDFGKALLEQGDTDRAANCLLQARSLNPGDAEVNELLAELVEQAGSPGH